MVSKRPPEDQQSAMFDKVDNAYKRADENERKRAEARLDNELKAFVGAVGFSAIDEDETTQRQLPLGWKSLTDVEKDSLFDKQTNIGEMYKELSRDATEIINKSYDILNILSGSRQRQFRNLHNEFRDKQTEWNDDEDNTDEESFGESEDYYELTNAVAKFYAGIPKGDRAVLDVLVKRFCKDSEMTVSGWKSLVKSWETRFKEDREDEETDASSQTESEQKRESEQTEFEWNPYLDPDDLPVVLLETVDEEDMEIYPRKTHEVASNVMEHLQNNESLNLYKRGGLLVSLREADMKQLKSVILNEKGLRGAIGRACTVAKLQKKNGGKKISFRVVPVATPSVDIADDILNNQDYSEVKTIRGITNYPYLSNGKIWDTPGYNPDSGMFMSDLNLCKLEYPESPEEAVRIIEEVLGGFPFIEDSDFENAIGLMLTPLVRPQLKGMPPLFSIAAASQGSGKSFLSQSLLACQIGALPTMNAMSDNKEELRKELMTIGIEGTPYAIFDNVDPKKPLDSAELARFVTSEYTRGRILYRNETRTVENLATVIWTGSNVEVTRELMDRIVQIRIDSPKTRNADIEYDFNPIQDRLLPQRGRYLGALIYMIEHWIKEGMKLDKEVKHRQRDWAQVIGGILKACGIGEHFLQNDADMRRAANPEHVVIGETLFQIVYALGNDTVFGDRGFITAEIFEICSFKKSYYHKGEHFPETGDNLLGEYIQSYLKGNEDNHRKTALGKYFRTLVGNTYRGLEVVIDGKRGGRTVYKFIDHRSTKQRAADEEAFRIARENNEVEVQETNTEPDFDDPTEGVNL